MRYLSKLNWFRKNKKITLIGIVILAILFVLFRPKAPKPIATVTVEPGTIVQSISASGTIKSESSVDLSFLAGGKLSYLGVKKGDQVQQYQVIATLDQRTAQVNLENALIAYSKQRNTFDTTQENNANRKPQEALNDAMKRLLENNQNDLETAINSVELQSLAKEQSVLITPISGIVTRADVSSSGINVGPTTTFTITDLDNLTFNIDVDESDIGKVIPGQQINISLDAFPDRTIHAVVDSIDFASHSTTTGGTAYTVQAVLTEGGNVDYRIGMNGDAEIIISQKHEVSTIPLSSLIDEQHVYVQKGKTFEKRTVKLGIESDTQAQVVQGLNEGEKVALTPDDVDKQFPKLKSQ